MKAQYLEKPKKIVKKEIEEPEIAPQDVLVEMKSVGVCGSDIEYYDTGQIGEFVVEEPLILGHESAGKVVEVGDAVEDFEEGDRVTLEPGVPCRKCKHCKEGKYNLCPDVTFMATPPDDGAFVEYFAHPSDFTFKLPESLTYEEGALMEPLSVGVQATRRAEVDIGDNVAVLGSGPIGLVALQSAFAAGATSVTITDIVNFRLEKAEELGATETINVNDNAVDGLKGTFDKVIQTAGTRTTYTQAMELVDRGGRVVQVGHPSADELSIDPNLLITRAFDMVGSFRYANTYQDAIDLVESGKVDLKQMVSKHFPLDNVEEALNYSKDNPDKCIKAMVDINRS